MLLDMDGHYTNIPGFGIDMIFQDYYYDYILVDGIKSPLRIIKHWCDDLDLEIYYNNGSFFFVTKDDLLLFQLKWC